MDKLYNYLLCILFFSSFSMNAVAQTRISGTVKDSKGLGLPGVSVKIKGSEIGTITNGDGKYNIQTTEASGILVFTYIGFLPKEFSLAGKSVINVTLEEDSQGLNEVVVVGYGTQKKVNLTGSVAQINGEQLVDKPVPNALAALQGVSPGVTVYRGSGKPGDEGYGLRIRGFSSANATSALVLVDGVEMDLALINPNDIESISVLKDAAAASIYGARAAGGVVLVTTKKATSGKTKINFSSNYSLNITSRQPERLNSWDEQTLIDEARFNATGAKEFTDEQIQWLKNPNFDYRPNLTADRWEYFDNINWIKEGMDKVNPSQNYALSVGGGKQELNYLLSGGYNQRDGVLRFGPDDNSRKNLRLSVNAELNKYVSVGVVAGYVGSTVNQNSYSTDRIIDLLYRVRTRQSLYTPAEDITGQPYNGDLQLNPVDIEKNGGLNTNTYESFTGKVNVTVKNFLKGLTLDFVASRNQDNYNSEIDRPTLYWYGRSTNTVRQSLNVPNSISLTKNKGYHDNLTGQFTYDLQLNQKHNFKLLGGASFEQYRKDEISAGATNMITNDFFSLNFGDQSTKTNSDKVETWAFGSLFGRFNYNYDEKYLFEATVRYDGSSRLAPENRFQVFPAFSAGWRMSEEPFIKNNLPFVTNLKLRGSWGQLGNGAVLGLYDYIPLITSGLTSDQPHLIFNGTESQFLYQNTLASTNKTWEIVEVSNIAIDAGFFKNRLNFTAEYYNKFNKNMLATLNLPHIIGVGVGSSNVGELKSWGTELELSWRDTFQNGNYHIGFNISDNQNKLIKYNGNNSIGSGGNVALMEGYPLNTVWGYKTDGYFQTQAEADDYKAKVKYPFFGSPGPGDVKYLDLDGNGVIDAGGGTPDKPGDLVNLGTTNARYTYGLNLGASWKGFDFSVFFQGAAKRSFLIDQNTLSPILGTSNMPWTIHMDHWTPDNPNAFFPRMYQTSAHNFQPSDKWTQNGTYIRLKNVMVAYNFKVNKKYLQNLKVYFSGEDLFESTDVLNVFDPEVGNNVASGTYPFYRSVSFGVNVTL